MGRFIKNPRVKSGSYTLGLPLGPLPVLPGDTLDILTPYVDGQMRFNTVKNNIEVYYLGAWHLPTAGGRVTIRKDTFYGDGSTSTFVMTAQASITYFAGNEAEVLVFIGNVFQNPGVAYQFDPVFGPNIHFTSPPDPGVTIVVLHNYNSTIL